LRGLAEFAAATLADVVARPDVVVVTFVPADPLRRLRRGHRPAADLARLLGARWELPVEDLLARKPGSPQRGLSLVARRANVRGAFHATASAPPRVLLVDDVYTSGATASEAASALRKAGARQVHVAAFARATRS